MIPRQELTAGHASVAWLLKARPVTVTTLRWRAERRRIFSKGRCAIDYLKRFLGAPSPRIFAGVDSPAPPVCEGRKSNTAYPGPQRIWAAERWLRLFDN